MNPKKKKKEPTEVEQYSVLVTDPGPYHLDGTPIYEYFDVDEDGKHTPLEKPRRTRK